MQLDRGFSDDLPYADASFDRVLSAFMFHHLELREKEKTLRETRRVLVGGGSLHLVDFGGADAGSDGFIARLLHRTARLRDNVEDRILTLMRNAGFVDPTEVAHRATIFGRVTYYRAQVARAGSEPEKATCPSDLERIRPSRIEQRAGDPQDTAPEAASE